MIDFSSKVPETCSLLSLPAVVFRTEKLKCATARGSEWRLGLPYYFKQTPLLIILAYIYPNPSFSYSSESLRDLLLGLYLLLDILKDSFTELAMFLKSVPRLMVLSFESSSELQYSSSSAFSETKIKPLTTWVLDSSSELVNYFDSDPKAPFV